MPQTAALQPQLVGEFHDQNAVLGHQADQHDQPDLRIDVERYAGQKKRKDRRRQRERHGQQHHQRARQAFELRHQHQEHDDEGKNIGEQQIARRFLQRLRIALQDHVDIVGHALVGQPLDLRHRIRQGDVRIDIGLHLDRAALLGAVQLGCNAFLADAGDGGQRHQSATFGPHEQIAQIGRVGDRYGLRGQEDRDRLIVDIQIHHLVPADHRAQGGRQIIQIDAEIGGALAIDLHG